MLDPGPRGPSCDLAEEAKDEPEWAEKTRGKLLGLPKMPDAVFFGWLEARRVPLAVENARQIIGQRRRVRFVPLTTSKLTPCGMLRRSKALSLTNESTVLGQQGQGHIFLLNANFWPMRPRVKCLDDEKGDTSVWLVRPEVDFSSGDESGIFFG